MLKMSKELGKGPRGRLLQRSASYWKVRDPCVASLDRALPLSFFVWLRMFAEVWRQEAECSCRHSIL